jgi:hypothetical protein
MPGQRTRVYPDVLRAVTAPLVGQVLQVLAPGRFGFGASPGGLPPVGAPGDVLTTVGGVWVAAAPFNPAVGNPGDVLTTVGGVWVAAPPTTPVIPVVAGAYLRVEASALSGFVPGNPVGLWADQESGGHDFSSAGAARPLFQLEDGIPYLQYDGAAQYLLNSDGVSPATPTITVYIVVRCLGSGGFPGIASQSDAANNDFDDVKRFVVEIGTATSTSPKVTRNNNAEMKTPYSFQTGGIDDLGRWGIVVIRWQQLFGEYMGSMGFFPGWWTTNDIGASPGSNFTFTHTALGARLNGGVIGNFAKCHLRHYSRYHVAHTDGQIAQQVAYLRQAYLVPVL